jgi:shikimate dehydrogenase
VDPSRVQDAVLGLRALGFIGANVTVPHKETVLPFLDELCETAKTIGAVNTIVMEKESRLMGYNTDAEGFIRDLSEHKIAFKDMDALILGAGGSARAVTYALLKYGCKDVTIANRTASKANELASALSEFFPQAKIAYRALASVVDFSSTKYQFIINTTSIGMSSVGNEMPLPADIEFMPGQVVYDLIYYPAKTALLRRAEKCGARAINGLGMLVHQGALSFKLWTGITAPVDSMHDVARREMQKRLAEAGIS